MCSSLSIPAIRLSLPLATPTTFNAHYIYPAAEKRKQRGSVWAALHDTDDLMTYVMNNPTNRSALHIYASQPYDALCEHLILGTSPRPLPSKHYKPFAGKMYVWTWESFYAHFLFERQVEGTENCMEGLDWSFSQEESLSLRREQERYASSQKWPFKGCKVCTRYAFLPNPNILLHAEDGDGPVLPIFTNN